MIKFIISLWDYMITKNYYFKFSISENDSSLPIAVLTFLGLFILRYFLCKL